MGVCGRGAEWGGGSIKKKGKKHRFTQYRSNVSVCRLLEEEKQAHEMLKQTWQMANDQFLESQRLIMMDLRRMESVLSSEQQRQIAGERWGRSDR